MRTQLNKYFDDDFNIAKSEGGCESEQHNLDQINSQNEDVSERQIRHMKKSSHVKNFYMSKNIKERNTEVRPINGHILPLGRQSKSHNQPTHFDFAAKKKLKLDSEILKDKEHNSDTSDDEPVSTIMRENAAAEDDDSFGNNMNFHQMLSGVHDELDNIDDHETPIKIVDYENGILELNRLKIKQFPNGYITPSLGSARGEKKLNNEHDSDHENNNAVTSDGFRITSSNNQSK